MRLALVSDVHADHWKPVGAPLLWKRAPLADVLLVAGDLHDYQDGTADELRKAALRYPLVVWVDGNHEGYTHGADLAGSARHAAALELPDNVVFLGARQTLLRDGVLFVGASAWWDFAFCAPEKDPEDARRHFRKACFQEDDLWFSDKPSDARPMDAVIEELAAEDAAHLAAVITAAQADAAVHAIVVLTHTVPHRSLLRKGVYPKSLLDAAFYGNSACEALPALDTGRKIALWAFGHSHAGADAQLGHVRYLSHPRGRPDDFNRFSYEPLLLELHAGPDHAPQVSVLPPRAEKAPAEVVA